MFVWSCVVCLDSLLQPPIATAGSSPDQQPIALSSINHVTRYLPVLEASKDKLITEMEAMVFEGLSGLNQPILASSLQTAFNLGLLPSLVRSLLSDLTDAVETRIKKTFDTTHLAREAGIKGQCPRTSRWLIRVQDPSDLAFNICPMLRRRRRDGLQGPILSERAHSAGGATVDERALGETRDADRGHGVLLHQGQPATLVDLMQEDYR